jgi:hypothetical protein
MAEATAIIYIMESSLGNKVYIGSTEKTIQERRCQHIQTYKHSRYCSSHILFNEYEIDNVSIRILEIVPITIKRNREQYWILQHPNNINQFKAFRSLTEKQEYNKEWIKNNCKSIICECGEIVSRDYDLDRHLQSIMHIQKMNGNYIAKRKRQCDICKKYINSKNLARHIQQLHTAQTETKSPE